MQKDYPRWLFAQSCDFIAGAALFEQIPPTELSEVAFVGRSNVGKSSIINALTGRNSLARVSHTPGRTKQINFFNLGGKIIIVDLPGYGYAKAAKAEVQGWNDLIFKYLRKRPNLRRVMLLIDSRHGLKPSDLEIMKTLDMLAVTYQIVLTKIDKVKGTPEFEVNFKKHPALYHEIIETSAHDKIGINLLQGVIASITENK